MASELFGPDWVQKMEEEHDEATRQFKAAVASARSGSDEAVRQVSEAFCAHDWLLYLFFDLRT